MAEDAEEEKTSTDSGWENSREKVLGRDMKRGERFLADGEREILASRRREQEPDDEEVFNSVLQEFFP